MGCDTSGQTTKINRKTTVLAYWHQGRSPRQFDPSLESASTSGHASSWYWIAQPLSPMIRWNLRQMENFGGDKNGNGCQMNHYASLHISQERMPVAMKRLGELSDLIDARVIGDSDVKITGAASVSRAGKGEITFAVTRKHVEHFISGNASAAVISAKIEISEGELDGKPVVVADDAERGFTQIVKLLRSRQKRSRIGISSKASVDPTANIAEDVDIYPGAFVGANVEIGCGCVVYPNATILNGCKIGTGVSIFPNSTLYENTVVGDRCIIHAGAVLGANGFGYRSENGKHTLSAQLGNVVLGNDVEVGANTTIDRGTYDSTTVADGTKLDNLVQIGHNCQLGENNLLCSQVGIAGSSTTGDNVTMGGQVGVSDHVHIGTGVTLGAKAGVMSDLLDQKVYLGAPALPSREHMQVFALSTRLPEMRKQIKGLTKEVKELQARQSSEQTPRIAGTDSDAA